MIHDHEVEVNGTTHKIVKTTNLNGHPNVHPYKGSVLNQFGEVVGWTRIVFNKDPLEFENRNGLLFEGAFTTNDGMFHLSSIENYRISRRSGIDIDIVSPYERESIHRNTKLIVYKDSFNPLSLAATLPPTEMTSAHGCGFKFTESNKLAIIEARKHDFNPKRHQKRLLETDFAKFNLSAKQSDCYFQDKKILPMGVAVDCSYFATVGDVPKTLNRVLNVWNLVSQLYEATFNIQIAIVEVKIFQTCGSSTGISSENLSWNSECTQNYILEKRLTDFSEWRGKKNTAPDNAGLWHLMSRCSSGTSIGLAWISMLCEKRAISQQSDWVSGTGVSTIVPTEWRVVAHEIGHNFGAIHDCEKNSCPSFCFDPDADSCECCPCSGGCDCLGEYMMHPSDNSIRAEFSPCSVQKMCKNLKLELHKSCLMDPTELKQKSTTNICGNGIVEVNEECDCGQNCDINKCCGTDCKFISPAVCDQSTQECCENCQFKPAGAICRSSLDMCTLNQTCTGKEAFCHKSAILTNGVTCIPSGAPNNAKNTICASGVCTSRDLQCAGAIETGFSKTIKACKNKENSCVLECETEGGSCIELNDNFLDGTACLGGGYCEVQPITCVIVLVIILIVLGYIIRLIVHYIRRRRQPDNQIALDPAMANYDNNSTWVDPQLQNIQQPYKAYDRNEATYNVIYYQNNPDKLQPASPRPPPSTG
ncbi:hypothetical protein HDU92_007957 [Lobulomyces angularis]|nr:hypothetical protein HDU92_007957 [Lobulomyces angularis]